MFNFMKKAAIDKDDKERRKRDKKDRKEKQKRDRASMSAEELLRLDEVGNSCIIFFKIKSGINFSCYNCITPLFCFISFVLSRILYYSRGQLILYLRTYIYIHIQGATSKMNQSIFLSLPG